MAIVSFENVSFVRAKKELLSSITWQMKEGEHWAILGLNGAGKTLLLQLICGYLWPSSGKLQVLDQTFGHTSIPELQRRIGWVSSALQYKIKQHETAEHIVLSGKFASIGIWESFTSQEVEKAKQLLISLDGKKLIGQQYQVLSQGERQLVLIARALMAEPELLILDEPCNGLDIFAKDKLLNQIQQIAAQKNQPNLLYVSHHTEEILPCFRHIMLLRDGQLVAKGTRAALFNEHVLTTFYQHPIQLIPLKDKQFAVYPKS